MSGVVKGVKKAFKKVVPTVIKIAPYALAAAAIYFTAGAALGVPAMAGGWGAASAGLVGSLGAGSTLSAVMAGALTTAGYGAVAGGALSLIGGGDMTKNMQMGMVGGALAGGVMGGLGAGMATGAPVGAAGTAAGPAAPGMPTALTVAEGGGIGALGRAAGPAAATAGGMTPAAAAPAGGGGAASFLGQGGWLERNAALAGPVISGLGQGLLQGAAAGDEGKAMMRRDQAERDHIASNYGSGEVPFTQVARPQGNPTPTQRFDTATGYSPQWHYDPAARRMVRG